MTVFEEERKLESRTYLKIDIDSGCFWILI